MQTAVFVDAGYLYAQASVLLAGSKQPRATLLLDIDQTIAQLKELCRAIAPESRLLRIYWYDGLQRSARMTAEQEQVASASYTKLRLGVVNSKGEQKGVDSLIVTDLIDLARNRAITNAVLVSGDEDIRIGVQIAQTFGVQVHLLGIKPARGSQSPDLIQEADTHHEFDESVISRLLTIKPASNEGETHVTPTATAEATLTSPDQTSLADQAIAETLDSFDPDKLASALRAFKAGAGSIPPELDRPALGRLKSLQGSDLTPSERSAYRDKFRARLQSM
ncbi:NYN domain-containing protein [Gemmobacter aquarius]|uniref:NYN domain-containing protein n=1 Tax=Paragemmobacter aquarius TaxID=2169400 RepID=A0A2S0UN95_9RHOB|nr:NYN domain-containing protein [Gemmobacter aquarius]AWB49284.1 NYN domain-containing protein [Gemmobacter aquarius]